MSPIKIIMATLLLGTCNVLLVYKSGVYIPGNYMAKRSPASTPPITNKVMNSISVGDTRLSATTAPDATNSKINTIDLYVTNTNEEGWKSAIATIFWVGEGEGDDNGFIHNRSSAWDEEWQLHFGGVDDPLHRCGFNPCGFTPKENPFYVALPYNDINDNGERKESPSRVPWFDTSKVVSQLKNRWIEVRVKGTGKSCFGQWEDVGPFEEDDLEYVLGTVDNYRNRVGEKAGIDLSPAIRDCLRVGGVSTVEWRHHTTQEIPAGPWLSIITVRE